jgi:hypothetical protein
VLSTLSWSFSKIDRPALILVRVYRSLNHREKDILLRQSEGSKR